MNDQPGVIIAGASVRAAAASAVRAGYKVHAVDLFGDADLRNIATCHVIPAEQYPHAIADIVNRLPCMPWFYTGALENRPALVKAIASRHALLGNCAKTLRHIRDPFALSAALKQSQLRTADVLPELSETTVGQWMKKPLASAGGSGVARINAADAHQPPSRGSCYFQKYIEGESHSAAYLMAGGRSILLGVTRQLHGGDFGIAPQFGYVGSIGPLRCSEKMWQRWKKVGAAVAQAFSLKGLVGIDAIVDSSGDIFAVEVNPRFTASMELFERAGHSLFPLHLAACRDGVLPDQPPRRLPRTPAGKAIAFAGYEAVEITYAFAQHCLDRSSGNAPQVADVPHARQQIQPGHPVATVFVHGADQQHIQQQLRVAVADLLRRAT